MSTLKYLKGFIPISKTTFQHLDSYNKPEFTRINKNEAFFERNVDNPIKIIHSKRRAKSFDEKHNVSKSDMKSLSDVKSLLRFNDFDPQLNHENNNNNNIKHFLPIINKSYEKSEKYKKQVQKCVAKNIQKQPIYKENKSQSFFDADAMEKQKKLEDRLMFLQKTQLSLKQNNFSRNSPSKTKLVQNHEGDSILNNIFSEKELRKILKDQRENIKSNYIQPKKKKNPTKNLKSLMRFSSLDSRKIHLKYIRKAKSIALNEDELLSLKILAEKIAKNINKLHILNNLNQIKSFYDLQKLFNELGENEFELNEIFLSEENGKKINPLIDAPFIFKNFFIDNFKYNDSSDKESLEINKKFVNTCQKLVKPLKELIFEKRLKNLKKEKEEIIHDNKKLINLQKEVLSTMKFENRPKFRKNFEKFQKFQTTLGKHNTPFDLMKSLKKFEYNYGPLKIKNKDRILGEELNEMILGVKNTLIWMDIYDKDQFQSIQ